MNGGFGGLLVVRRGISSRQDQGRDQDGNSTGPKKYFFIGLSWVFHNQLMVNDVPPATQKPD